MPGTALPRVTAVHRGLRQVHRPVGRRDADASAALSFFVTAGLWSFEPIVSGD
jgi:hypothetical protein